MDKKQNRHSFLSRGKTYVLSSDTCLTFEKGDGGDPNVGWTGIKYDRYTGECTSLDNTLHYATLKLVEDDEDKGEGEG